MKNPSADWLYAKLEKEIKLAEAFGQIKNLGFIITACRLKPYDYVIKRPKKVIKLYKYWFDEFGNSITINKVKEKLQVIHNELSKIQNNEI